MSPRSWLRPPPGAPLALALLAAASGCAQTKVSRIWSDQGLEQGRYRRVMVLVVAASDARRQTAEDRIAAELGRRGADAIVSWRTLSEAELGSRERIREAVEGSGADALLAVRVTAVGKEQEVEQGREAWVPVATGYDYYGYVTTSYGLYRTPEVYQTLSVTTETTLWDVARRRMVWACQSDSSSAKETLTTTELADDYARVVAAKVRPYLSGK